MEGYLLRLSITLLDLCFKAYLIVSYISAGDAITIVAEKFSKRYAKNNSDCTVMM